MHDELTRARFWAKVNKVDDGCWEWTAYKWPNGYGLLRVGSLKDGTRRNAYAHRLAWEIAYGPIPEGQMQSQVDTIRQLLAEGKLTQRAIAKQYGVHEWTISAIKLGKNWKQSL